METIIEIWADTGAVVERPMTEDELAQREADRAAEEARKVAAETAAAEVAAAKQAILDRLGLTAEEAKMLLS